MRLRRPIGTFSTPVNLPGALAAIGLAVVAAMSSCTRSARPSQNAAAAAKASVPVPVAPPPLALVPAGVARTALVASFVIPSLERSLASGVGLIKQAAPLPLDATGVRDMLLAQAGLPPELTRHLDTAAPLAGASVVGGQAGMPLTAFSFAARSPGDVTALLAALGRNIGRRGNAIQIENAAGDRGWFLPSGKVVVFADTDEALIRAGSLALEARRIVPDDVSVVVYPEMLARAAGTTVKAALARFQREMEDRAAAGGTKMGPEATRQAAALMDYVGDTDSAELALNLDGVRGASLLARLRPKGGSRLEALARETTTVPVDPALLRTSGEGEAGIVLTSAHGQAVLEQLARVRGKLPSEARKPVTVANNLMGALAEGLTGHLSLMGRVQPSISGEFMFPVRDAASAARIQTALLASDKDSIAMIVRAATQGEGPNLKVLSVRRETVGRAKSKALHITLAPVLPASADSAMRRLWGTGGIEAFMTVVTGDRLAITIGQGRGAKARLAQILSGEAPNKSAGSVVKASAAPTATTRSGVVADAMTTAGPRSWFFFLDLRQIVALVAASGGNPRLRMVAGAMSTPLPVMGGATGAGQGQGRTFTVDLIIPPSCFAGMGAIFQAAMMGR